MTVNSLVIQSSSLLAYSFSKLNLFLEKDCKFSCTFQQYTPYHKTRRAWTGTSIIGYRSFKALPSSMARCMVFKKQPTCNVVLAYLVKCLFLSSCSYTTVPVCTACWARNKGYFRVALMIAAVCSLNHVNGSLLTTV